MGGQNKSTSTRLGVNFALTSLFILMQLLLAAATVGAADDARHAGIGLLRNLAAPWNALLGIVALDGCAWAVHRLMHASPALWRVHRVHHSDTFVDVTTAYRQHPLETGLRFAFTLVPALALGLAPATVAAYRALSALNALLEHADVRYPRAIEAALGGWLVTPERHKVHHSRERAQTDSNYANILCIWDRVFGTLRPASEAAAVRYGLDEVPQDARLLPLLRLKA